MGHGGALYFSRSDTREPSHIPPYSLTFHAYLRKWTQGFVHPHRLPRPVTHGLTPS
jgi:hypothetical protein